MGTLCFKKKKKAVAHEGEGVRRNMAIYIIMRIYRVPGKNQVEATDRMAEAIELHVEEDFHVKDIVKKSEDRVGQWKGTNLRPARGWRELLKKQLRF
jgi:hypothetical protein